MKVRNIFYQKRDIAFCNALGRVVVMDDSMIQEEFFRNDKTGDSRARRLRLLMADGRISRMRLSQVSMTADPPKLLSFYRLARGGADLLAQLGMPPQRLLRGDPRPETLLHRRDLARTMLALNNAAAAAGLPEPEWILEQDQRPGAHRKPKLSRAERFVLYEDFKTPAGETLKLRPDASSWLRFPHQGGWHDLLVWWEIDRSSEGLPQITAKLPPYEFLFREEEPGGRRVYLRHWSQIPRATLRLFFVCLSIERIRTISSAIRSLPGAEYVRLATLDSLKADNEERSEYHGQGLGSQKALRAKIWYDVLGKCHAIYPAAK